MFDYRTMIATNRFGMGARPGEGAGASADPRGWLLAQLEDPGASRIESRGLKNSHNALVDWYAFQSARRAADKENEGDEQAVRKALAGMEKPRETYVRELVARTRFSIETSRSFRERLVRFWSNHFTVSTTQNSVVPVAGAFEREAIRPHVTGFFSEMLIAAETHPAMLLYLDNARSVGPNSRGGRRRDRGLNENLAREILELHTVGVAGGYSQEDVTGFAKVLTGWTVGGPRDQQRVGKTWFDARRHEPGAQRVMGKKYTEDDSEQALHVLRDLSIKPETARFVAIKLARHFISDTPPESAIEKLSSAFLSSAGNLKAVAAKLVDLEEAWVESPAKFKTPEEFQLSVYRGLGQNAVQARGMRSMYQNLGQAPFSAPSPEGWPDDEAAWLGPDSLKKRLEWAQSIASRINRRTDPREFLGQSLGATASDRTRFMVAGADSMKQGVTLAIMSPEFQRR